MNKEIKYSLNSLIQKLSITKNYACVIKSHTVIINDNHNSFMLV